MAEQGASLDGLDMIAARESLRKVETKDGELYLFIQKIENQAAGFAINICDGCAAWNGQVTENMLKNMAEKAGMNIEEYTSETYNALTGNNTKTDLFIYQIIQNKSLFEFSWKKQLEDGVKFQLGSISLSEIKEKKALIKKIFDFSIGKICDYRDRITTMNCNLEQLVKDRDNAVMRLDKCLTSKEEMETDLYQKFVTVLNDKKAKIRRLQETMREQSKQESGLCGDSNAETSLKLDATSDRSRDEEMEQSENKDKSEEMEVTSSNIGSCLFEEEEDSAPVVKRRRKQPDRKPVRTASKPVLPEVKTSVTRRSSNASSSSNNSDQSKQSDGNMRRSRRNKDSSTFPDDVEDLFGEMA